MEREIVLSSYSVKNKDNNKPENYQHFISIWSMEL